MINYYKESKLMDYFLDNREKAKRYLKKRFIYSNCSLYMQEQNLYLYTMVQSYWFVD
jgi:hypothetical protein